MEGIQTNNGIYHAFIKEKIKEKTETSAERTPVQTAEADSLERPEQMAEADSLERPVQTAEAESPEQTGAAEQPESAKKKSWPLILAGVVVLAAAAGSAAAFLAGSAKPKGYHDYTIQKQQYYVEYSDQYDYWDVLTIEYPVLAQAEGQGIEQLEVINSKLYETAMDRVNYWHLEPDDEVRKLQEEYHIFSSDVECDVPYHSQYLMSVNYREIYAPVNPVWYVYTTQRALTIDLLSGESYALKDVLRVDEEFVSLWAHSFNEKLGEELITSEDEEIFVDWLNGSDEELSQYYEFVPFYYLTQEGNFVVGVSLDPTVAGLTTGDPSNSTFYAELTAQELAPWRTESVFWDRYDESEMTGEVMDCEERHENLWLGDQASVWDYWEGK